MSDDKDFTIDTGTGNVLLHGELLHNKSSEELKPMYINRESQIRNVQIV